MGMRAYKNLEFDAATLLLRRGVVQLTAANAPVARRAKGLVYLGAAELFRGRRDSAVAVFRRLVVLDPRYRPDQLVFPPEVTSVFEAVRLRTKTVAIVVSRDTEVPVQNGAFRAWLVASSFQTVNVTLLYENGTSFRPLYFGPIGDSLEVQWDGRDAAGQPVPVDRLLLRVASRAPTGELASMGSSHSTSRSTVPTRYRGRMLPRIPRCAPSMRRAVPRRGRYWVGCSCRRPSSPCPWRWAATTRRPGPASRSRAPWESRPRWDTCCIDLAGRWRRTFAPTTRCGRSGGPVWRRCRRRTPGVWPMSGSGCTRAIRP